MSEPRKYIGPKDRAHEHDGILWFWCLACADMHAIYVGSSGWKWNRDSIYPTVRNIVEITGPKLCRSRITYGGIEYLDGSAHSWRGPYELPELREVIDVTHANDGSVLGWKKKEGGR